MTPTEFKAWFDGFTEAMSGQPTKAQWARIKERVAEIDGKSITERVYLDRYVPYYTPWNYPVTLTCGTTSASGATFNSAAAMYSLGCNEAQAMAA